MKYLYLLGCLGLFYSQGICQNQVVQLNNTAGQNIGAQLEVADYDGDGELEFIVIHSSGLLYYESGGLEANSWSPTTYQVSMPSSPQNLETVDIDDDGDLDVFFATDGVLYIFLNDGTGTFEIAAISSTYFSSFSREVAFGDFDGDGDIDIAHACFEEVIWVENLDNWSSIEIHLITNNSGAAGYRGAVGVDWNQDGVDEIIALMAWSGEDNRLFSSDGEGGFTYETIPGLNGGVYSYDIKDIDNDGILELGFGTNIGMRFMELGGSEVDAISYTENYPDGGRFIDIDNDGAFEWIQVGWGPGNIVYVDFDSNGNALGYNEAVFTIPYADDMYVFDADGNGQLDLIFTGYSGQPTVGGVPNFVLSNTSSILSNTQTDFILVNTRDGFWIQNEWNQPMQIEVFTVDGKKVHDANHASLEIIPTSNWNTGIYLVKADGQFVEKLWVE